MKTTLIIPTLNEIEGVRVIMPQIDRSWCDEVIILDGGSTDGTIEYLQTNGWRVLRQKAPDLARAYKEVHDVAIGDVFITFSPDGNSIPRKIPELIAKMREGFDMVIVSRYLDGAKSEDDDILTGFGNWMFTNVINLVYRAHYTDALVLYRAYKREVVASLDIKARNLMFEAQLSMRAAKYGLKIGEIPGDEPKRIGGMRKMKPFRDGLHLIREIVVNLVR